MSIFTLNSGHLKNESLTTLGLYRHMTIPLSIERWLLSSDFHTCSQRPVTVPTTSVIALKFVIILVLSTDHSEAGRKVLLIPLHLPMLLCLYTWMLPVQSMQTGPQSHWGIAFVSISAVSRCANPPKSRFL